MKKKLLKLFDLTGCVMTVGIGGTMIHVGLKMVEWAFSEMKYYLDN